jgi:hypothetical protein
MTSRELLAEAFAATANVRTVHFERLAELGVEKATLMQLSAYLPLPGATSVRTAGRHYIPDESGETALIVPVAAPVSFELWGEVHETIQLVDLVAFRTSAPAIWHWRVGSAWAIGEELIVADCGEPVELVATPLDWLRTGGSAACILDWSEASPAWAYLRALPEIVVTDDLLRARVTNAVRQAVALPKMRRARHAA